MCKHRTSYQDHLVCSYKMSSNFFIIYTYMGYVIQMGFTYPYYIGFILQTRVLPKSCLHDVRICVNQSIQFFYCPRICSWSHITRFHIFLHTLLLISNTIYLPQNMGIFVHLQFNKKFKKCK